MKNLYFKQFVILLLINLLLTILGLFVDYFLFNFFYSVYSVFLFFLLTTFAVVSVLNLIGQHFKEYVGFAFMGLLLFKGLASILFLVPSFIDDPKPVFADLMLFFIPYFIFLTYEAVFSVRLVNQLNNN
ncbi:MAG: hypothetical protein LAT51_03755 [Flavobacteriaceae bacterium]|nr:hypothetical protein [Flavobacteriaceae bacterium]